MSHEAEYSTLMNYTRIPYQLPFKGYRQTLAYAYTLVDLIGFCSNIWVLYVVWPLLLSTSFRVPKSIIFYIVVLCISDLCTMIGLIFVILDMIRGMWIFGEIACNVYLLVEACNKFFPPFIVVLISRTCYKTVCQNGNERKKASSMSSAAFQTSIAFGVVVAMVLPHLLYSGTLDIIVARDNSTMTATYLLRCSFLPPPIAELFFDVISFIVSYFIPLIGTIYYFVSVPLFLKKRAENSLAWNSTNEVTVCKVVTLVVLLMAVYIVCWTPYWLCRVGYKLFYATTKTFQITSLILHLLPYVSCTVYPLIFTLMNRRIKAAHAQFIASSKSRQFLRFFSLERRSRLSLNWVSSTTTVRHSLNSSRPSPSSMQKMQVKLESKKRKQKASSWDSSSTRVPSPASCEQMDRWRNSADGRHTALYITEAEGDIYL